MVIHKSTNSKLNELINGNLMHIVQFQKLFLNQLIQFYFQAVYKYFMYLTAYFHAVRIVSKHDYASTNVDSLCFWLLISLT